MDRDKWRNRRQIKHLISEVPILHNRLLKMFGITIALVLAVMTVLTVQAGLATKAVADRSYDQVEQQRAARSAAPSDRSYDSLEALRARRAWASAAATCDAQRANAAYAARWQALAQAYAPH